MSDRPLTDSQRILAEQMLEAELQKQVTACFVRHKMVSYHTHDSRRSEAGFPDCVAFGPIGKPISQQRIIFAELKKQKKNPEPEQRIWLEGLLKIANFVYILTGRRIIQVYVFRPSDLLTGKIDAILSGELDTRSGGGMGDDGI